MMKLARIRQKLHESFGLAGKWVLGWRPMRWSRPSWVEGDADRVGRSVEPGRERLLKTAHVPVSRSGGGGFFRAEDDAIF